MSNVSGANQWRFTNLQYFAERHKSRFHPIHDLSCPDCRLIAAQLEVESLERVNHLINNRLSEMDILHPDHCKSIESLKSKLLVAKGDLMHSEDHRADLRSCIEKDRQAVIRLLGINNQEESIEGACRNRMQEVISLRSESERLDGFFRWLEQYARRTGNVELYDMTARFKEGEPVKAESE